MSEVSRVLELSAYLEVDKERTGNKQAEYQAGERACEMVEAFSEVSVVVVVADDLAVVADCAADKAGADEALELGFADLVIRFSFQ
jgi:hypothetical protein